MIETKELQINILSGLTVGVVALPLSMALAIASGVPPQYGLYTAIIAGIVIALAGSSKVNISGPTAAFVVILLPITQEFGLGGLLLSGLMAGIILVLMGIGRLGSMIELVPYPVTVGFTSGIAVVIATIQVKDFLGLDIENLNGHYWQKLETIIYALPSLQWQEILIASITLFVLIAWPKCNSSIPSHLVALAVGSALAYAGQYFIPSFSVATIGTAFHYSIDGILGHGIPPIAPQFAWPWQLPNAQGTPIGLSFDLISSLFGAAFAIAILGAIESLLCAVVSDSMNGTKTDPNRELIGQGIGNIIVPFFGGIPATAAIARTAMNVRAGGSLPLSSIIHALFILLSIVLLASLLSYIPMASMAALLIIVAWNMSEAKHFIHVIKVAPRHDVMVLLTCFSLTVMLDMEIAVASGMVLAAVLFIKRTIELTGVDLIKQGDSNQYPDLSEEVIVYDINGPMFFGAAQNALKTLANIRVEIKVVVIDMDDVSMMDMTAIVAMGSIVENLKKKDIQLIINAIHPRIKAKLIKANVIQENMHIEFFSEIKNSISRANELTMLTKRSI
ncbi:MAG: C4-dicarboxylic acid transporter DauA [Mariprofundaceae bacterium]|nr:C4-dicarboxylic acid transporter DauA [Mariprofundaceae bacterium]